MFSWFKNRRRRRILAAPFPAEWLPYLDENVHPYAYLSPQRQQVLRERIQIFVAEKNWVECGGLVIDDEVRVTIAGLACLMVLGFDGNYCFDGVRSVLVYPGAFLRPPQARADQLLVVEQEPATGESWHRGPIVLSWADALAGGRDETQGRNLVLHEFAHHLDDLEGGMDGVPPLASRSELRQWNQVIEREYQRLLAAAQQGRVTLLEHYGARNRAEFFAVSTECFFERPAALQRAHGELYHLLCQFYRQDPLDWYGGDPRARAPLDAEGRPLGAERWQEMRYEASVQRCVREMQLTPDSADARFAAAVIHAQHDRHDRAIPCYTAALDLAPADAEAYRLRAASQLALGQLDAALADAEEAVRLAPHDPDAYYQRGLTRARADEHAAAAADFTRAIDLAPQQSKYFLARSRIYDQQGLSAEAAADRAAAKELDPRLSAGREGDAA